MGGEVPHGRSEHVCARMKHGCDVVGFVAPVMKIAAAGTVTYTLPIHEEDELIVSADVDNKVLRHLQKVDYFSEMQHHLVTLRSLWHGDPLRSPGLRWRNSRLLPECHT